jgi:hypothetical protein
MVACRIRKKRAAEQRMKLACIWAYVQYYPLCMNSLNKDEALPQSSASSQVAGLPDPAPIHLRRNAGSSTVGMAAAKLAMPLTRVSSTRGNLPG